jgi:hypothetical protein
VARAILERVEHGPPGDALERLTERLQTTG